nr:zinc finger, CCHC-type [Tanacetum cinerariifolium]
MFEKPQAVEIYDLLDALHSCKQALGKSVSAHVLEMKGYMDQLHALGKFYDNDMAINLINRSLNKDFGDFVRNFNMHCVGKIVTKLHALLIDYEKGLKDKAPTPQELTIQKDWENKPKPWTLEEELPSLPRRAAKNKDKAEHGVAALEFKVFKLEVELQLGKKIKALHSDRGESTIRILNMVSTKKVDKTPYEIWHGKAPNLSYLKVWGCEAYVKRDSADKLHQRSVKCI